MSRVSLNKKNYKIKDFSGWVIGKLYSEQKTQGDLAKQLGISQQVMSYRIKHCIFSYGDLLTIFDYFDISDEEILYIMKSNK